MGYVGAKPSAVPLTSADITDGIITSAKIADGTIATADLNTGLTVNLGAGVVGTPSLTTSGDTNTGIFFPAADTIAFTEGGSEAMRITSGGEVLIGTTSVLGTGLVGMKSTASGQVLTMQNSNAAPFGIVIDYISHSPNGTGSQFIYLEDSTALRFEVRSNGGVANYSANNVNLASDERLKKDISLLNTSWDKIKALNIVNFRYKDCNEGDPLLYGVIAQQVQPIVPELVVVTQEAKEAVDAKEPVLDKDGNEIEPAVKAKEATPEYFGIREQPMYWLAIKALQEAMERIEQLETKNTSLEARLTALESN